LYNTLIQNGCSGGVMHSFDKTPLLAGFLSPSFSLLDVDVIGEMTFFVPSFRPLKGSSTF